MNNARDPRTKLLAETLHGDWAHGPAAAMARRAAAHARRRRSVRSALIALTGPVALAALFYLNRPTPPAPAASAPVAHRGYEIISDDELMTLLRDRPVLVLPQENGTKKIVVLDR